MRGVQEGNDERLLERIQILRTLLRDEKRNEGVLRWEVETEQEGSESPQIYLRVLNDRENSFLETAGMSRLLPAEAFPVAVGRGELPTRSLRVKSPAGRSFIVMAAAAKVGDGDETRVIQAALDLTPEERLLRRYRWFLAMALVCCALVSLGLGYRITRKGMRPLKEIIATTRRIGSSTLNERVSLAGLPAELAVLADNFNHMLDRLEQAFARLSRFSADLAHELRTPLNNLRGEAEVALGKARSAAEYREVLISSLEEYAELSRIIDSLLFIGLSEESGRRIECERVNLVPELQAIAEFYEAIATEKRVTLAVESEEGLWAEVDRVLFHRALGNVVVNAVTYTPPGGAVLIAAAGWDAAVRVEVSDNGIGIPPEHLPHIFDRFYRVEQGRSRSSGGVGLGLSIVKTIMDLHGGSVEIDSELARGTRMVLTFPQIAKS